MVDSEKGERQLGAGLSRVPIAHVKSLTFICHPYELEKQNY